MDKKQLIGVSWSIYGNQNRILREDMIETYRKDGYVIYSATYRPGFYTRRKEYETNPGVTKLYSSCKRRI